MNWSFYNCKHVWIVQIESSIYAYFQSLFNSNLLPPQPAGCVTGTPLLSLFSKNMLSHFLNSDFVGTKPKDAANPVTGLTASNNSLTPILFIAPFIRVNWLNKLQDFWRFSDISGKSVYIFFDQKLYWITFSDFLRDNYLI